MPDGWKPAKPFDYRISEQDFYVGPRRKASPISLKKRRSDVCVIAYSTRMAMQFPIPS